MKPTRDLAQELTQHRFHGEKTGSYTIGIEEAAHALEADRREVALAAVEASFDLISDAQSVPQALDRLMKFRSSIASGGWPQ